MLSLYFCSMNHISKSHVYLFLTSKHKIESKMELDQYKRKSSEKYYVTQPLFHLPHKAVFLMETVSWAAKIPRGSLRQRCVTGFQTECGKASWFYFRVHLRNLLRSLLYPQRCPWTGDESSFVQSLFFLLHDWSLSDLQDWRKQLVSSEKSGCSFFRD